MKATVDAYTGQVVLYAWDEQDPVLQTWMKAFPGTVQPRTAMPEEVLAHVRYPEDVFKVQREIFAQYHVTDPNGFYSGQDFWTVPNDPTKPAASTAQPPYYLQVQMPGASDPAFSLTTTFAPNKRQTLAAFMAANSEPGADYGKLRVLQLPSGTTIPGPVQAQNNFESDPTVSQQLSLLRRGGSEVELGNLLCTHPDKPACCLFGELLGICMGRIFSEAPCLLRHAGITCRRNWIRARMRCFSMALSVTWYSRAKLACGMPSNLWRMKISRHFGGSASIARRRRSSS